MCQRRPRSDCDLRATSGQNDKYLFEVKGFTTPMPSRQHYETARTMRNPWRSTALEQSKRESITRSTNCTQRRGEGADELRFVALLVRSKYDPEVVFQQILGRLYGKRSMIVGPGGPATLLECIYFSHSEFFRCQDGLDGAVVIQSHGAMLFVNDYGQRLDRGKANGALAILHGQ